MSRQQVIFEHAIGDEVEIVHAIDIRGHVCAQIRNADGDQYRVRWWQDGRLHDEAMFAWELRALEASK